VGGGVRTRFAAGAATLVVVACTDLGSLSGGGDGADAGDAGVDAHDGDTTPDFTATVAPPHLAVSAGSHVDATVTIARTNGFDAPISVSVAGLPGGASATPEPLVLTSGVASGKITITCDRTTPVGSVPLTFTAIAGALTHDATATLDVGGPSGTLDTSFGTNGQVAVVGQSVSAMAVQGDGKIVIAGGVVVSRLDASGKPDTSFMAAQAPFNINAVALAPAGNILLAGGIPNTAVPPVYSYGFVRLSANGAKDPSFGANGEKTLIVGGVNGGSAAAIIALPSGAIFAAGGGLQGTTLVSLAANGAPDPSFGTGGIASFAGPAASQLVIASDGSFVLAAGNLAHVAKGGTMVTTWTLPFSVAALAMTATGAYVVVGPKSGFSVARITTAGTLDASFGTSGVATTVIESPQDAPTSLALEPDGKIVVAGSRVKPPPGGTRTDWALARYTADGALDTSFGANGTVTGTDVSSDLTAGPVITQPDGKILVVIGSTTIARYWP
jgi:uncharacterized delta-60 repeat protein